VKALNFALTFAFVIFSLDKETVEGFSVFKSSKPEVEAVVLNEENDKDEDKPLKAKKEVYRQQEVSFISSPSSLFYVHMVDGFSFFKNVCVFVSFEFCCNFIFFMRVAGCSVA
jgi:hypothetical protein